MFRKVNRLFQDVLLDIAVIFLMESFEHALIYHLDEFQQKKTHIKVEFTFFSYPAPYDLFIKTYTIADIHRVRFKASLYGKKKEY